MNKSEHIHTHLMKITGAINCLFENKFIEAALMLTYAGIDQMSWFSVVDQESDGDDFKAWVDKYLMPSTKLGCSADDIWAARNGLVHMAAAESRDFYKFKAKRIYYVSGSVSCTENRSSDTIIINSKSLIVSFVEGAVNFVKDLEADAVCLTVAAKKAEAILVFRAASKNVLNTSSLCSPVSLIVI